MGLFGKLFEKKVCNFCGNEIKMLGNRKVEDGNMCKDCAAKLSPWFSDRKHTTVAEIQEQLDYREENKEAVAKFNTTRSFGRNTKIYVDENMRTFMVTAAKKFADVNPDVIDIDAVTNCDFDVSESRSELKRSVKQSDGTTKQVSYVPARYRYSYNFAIILHVNHPYFDEIRFNLNNSSVSIESTDLTALNNRRGTTLKQAIGDAVISGLQNAAGINNPLDPRLSNPDYVEYYNMGYEIKNYFNSKGASVSGAAASPAPKAEAKAVTCPWCGATTIPDEKGCCEYCGGAVMG